MKEKITIPEIAKFLNKHQNTVYRYIKQKKLNVVTVRQHGKNVVAVEKAEFERFCKDNDISMLQQVTTQEITGDNHVTTSYNNVVAGYNTEVITKENLKETFREFLEEQKTELMKPMEQQALYKLGAVEKENLFLQERLDTLRQENELLREQVKALPDFQREQDTLKVQVGALEREKADLLSRGETIRKETEEKLKQSEEIHRKELEARNELHREELQQTWKQAEEEQKNYLATIEELKKRLQEEEKKPWYRRLFS